MRRRWLFGLIFAAFLWVVITRFTEIEQLAITLAHGQWEWVLAALFVQGVYLVVFAASYQAAFRTVEIKSRLRDLVPVVLGALFVNLAAPTGGASGVALFVDDAARRGQQASRAATGLLLQLCADFTAFSLILIPGMIYLFRQHELKNYEMITAAILLLVILGLTAVLLIGVWRPALLQSLTGWLQNRMNSLAAWLKRPPFLADDWGAKNSAEFIAAANALSTHPVGVIQTVGLAFGAHLLDLACLYLLFLAFNQPVKLGPLVAGYGMGILFWVISITPQGVGVVEGVMILVFTSLGIPSAKATTISLAFRGLTFWLPMLVGFILLRRVKSFGAEEHELADDWSVRIAAILTALMGLINLLSAVTPALTNRWQILRTVSPLYLRHGGHLTAALSGFALLLLAAGLWRRKRTAWWLTLGILAVSALSHLVKGLDYEEALLAIGLAGWLFTLRREFYAHSDRPSIRQGFLVLLAALGFTLAYGALGFYLLDQHFKVNYGLGAALRQTVVMFTQFYDPGLQPVSGFGRFFGGSIYVIGAATTAYALLMLLRPVLLREPATEKQRQSAEALVMANGRSSLARLAILPDKAYYFSPGGSLTAYTVRQRVGLALGDPIGPTEDAPEAVQGFIAFCRTNDWIPAFYQTLPDSMETYRQAGLDLLCVGQEGIVDLQGFTTAGSENKPLRNAVNRLTRTNHRFELRLPPYPDSFLAELAQVSDEWLAMMHGSEKRFSLGWFDEAYVRSGPVAIVCGAEGQICAFANIVPEYQLNEVTVDLMRHRRNTEPGTMDFLFVSMFAWARDQGYATFNLGLSALYGVGENPDDPIQERTMHFIYEHVNQFYNFKGLHEFKEKFHPQWSPRYLAYPGAASLGRVYLALTEADSGESGLLANLLKLRNL